MFGGTYLQRALGGLAISAAIILAGSSVHANEAMKEHLSTIEKSISKVPRARVSSEFGMRTLGGRTRFHSGLDIAVEKGTHVKPLLSGIVTKAGWHGGYGKMVEVYHGMGITTRYAHLSEITTSLGKYVKKNMGIGRVGSTGRSTGNHLHFEIRINGKAINPRIIAKTRKKGFAAN